MTSRLLKPLMGPVLLSLCGLLAGCLGSPLQNKEVQAHNSFVLVGGWTPLAGATTRVQALSVPGPNFQCSATDCPSQTWTTIATFAVGTTPIEDSPGSTLVALFNSLNGGFDHYAFSQPVQIPAQFWKPADYRRPGYDEAVLRVLQDVDGISTVLNVQDQATLGVGCMLAGEPGGILNYLECFHQDPTMPSYWARIQVPR